MHYAGDGNKSCREHTYISDGNKNSFDSHIAENMHYAGDGKQFWLQRTMMETKTVLIVTLQKHAL